MKEILNEKQLKSIRKRKKMTQKEFAQKLGYSEAYIQKLEQGKKAHFRRICKKSSKNG